MLSVGSAIFFFMGVIERSGYDSLHNGRLAWRGYSPVIVVSFAISIMICWFFSMYSASPYALHMGVVSLIVGVMYIGPLRGIVLLGLGIAMYFIFNNHWSWNGLLIDTGLLLFPFICLISLRFRIATLKVKRSFVASLILLSAVLSMIISLLNQNAVPMSTELWIMVVMIVLAALAAGDYCVQAIERIIEKKEIDRQMLRLSNKFITEAEKLRQIMNVSPMIITSLDEHGRITSINASALQLMKRSFPDMTAESAIGFHFTGLQKEDITPGLHEVVTLTKAAQAGQETINKLLRLGYGSFYVNIVPLRTFSEEPSGVVILSQDTTELERLRNELDHVEQLSLVGKMAASITHEIRNPMAVVRGFLQLMQEKSPPSLDHYYVIVMDELDRANSIINDFLSLAQNRVVEKQWIHLHSIIEELLPLLWADANLRGQSIVFVPGKDLPELNLNSKEIKQLILNLARNGMESMDDKGELKIETYCHGNEVTMSIQDIGPGISPDKLEKLFEPFYTTKSKGTGLGLSLCLSIVERHHGRIQVESEEGVKTTFNVIFDPSHDQVNSTENKD
ncbi:ATP-binding protein [Paenibacillus sp. PK4536]|uniref:ATP-binding protein n=1 Tax=Paenibacillus sp. PK4536 TaxID=3024576 RepID=UPI002359E85C|nr:ATP-binding protein [Paenibacillus sp. PK4536]WIM40852.1 ATP-binding protein [Paenibacillus sp. PK4536]